MKNIKYKNRGFTLLETLIYAGLISVVIGFSLAATYQIIESSEKLNKKILVEDEANFLLRKIEWALTGLETINSPLSNATGSVLSVNKINFSGNPLIFDLNANNLRIKKGLAAPVVLNNENVLVSNLIFEHLATDGSKPAGIKADFNINERAYEIIIYSKK